MDVAQLGRTLVVVAVVMALAGGLLVLAGALGLGRLPGDLAIGRGSTRLYIPLASSVVISLAVTVVANLLLRR